MLKTLKIQNMKKIIPKKKNQFLPEQGTYT